MPPTGRGLRRHSVWPGLRRRTLGLVAAGVLGGVSVGLLVFAAYRGLERAMAPDLAAAVLGLALLGAATVAYAWSRLDAARAGASRTSSERPDRAAEVGDAVASMLRRADVGGWNLATLGLVAGSLLASWRSGATRAGPDRETALGNGRDETHRRS